MNKLALESFIDTITFPINVEETDNSRQLILEINNNLVSAYDPVYSLKVDNDHLVIEGWMGLIYKHKLSEFNAISIIDHDTDEVLQSISI